MSNKPLYFLEILRTADEAIDRWSDVDCDPVADKVLNQLLGDLAVATGHEPTASDDRWMRLTRSELARLRDIVFGQLHGPPGNPDRALAARLRDALGQLPMP